VRKDIHTKNKKKSKSFLRWIFWWQLDQEELDKQVAEYHSLKITQSARGQSFLLLLFVALATLVQPFFISGYENFVDVLIALVLGYFIYRGHQWAMISAMIWCSLGKFYLVYVGMVTPSPPSYASNPIIHLVFWALFMHAFYFAFRVERLRKQVKVQIPNGASLSKLEHLDELEKLAELKDKGIITEEEFNLKKRQILGL